MALRDIFKSEKVRWNRAPLRQRIKFGLSSLIAASATAGVFLYLNFTPEEFGDRGCFISPHSSFSRFEEPYGFEYGWPLVVCRQYEDNVDNRFRMPVDRFSMREPFIETHLINGVVNFLAMLVVIVSAIAASEMIFSREAESAPGPLTSKTEENEGVPQPVPVQPVPKVDEVQPDDETPQQSE